jgi:ferredoxin
VRIEIDTDICVGHGRCYALAPELFDSDEAGHGVVLASEVHTPEQVADAERAEANCPEMAVRLVRD